MQLQDIVLGGLVLFVTFQGFRKGLLMEVVSFLSYFIALAGALLLFRQVVTFVEKYIPQLHQIIPFIAFALVFFAIIKLVNYIGTLLKTAMSFTPFGIVDSLLGALIGLIKIVLILAAFLMLLEWLKYEQMIKWMSVSKLYPYIKGVANGLFNSWL